MPTSVNAVQAGLGSSNLIIVGVIAVLTLAALGLGLMFRAQVMKADAGSPKMQEIASAVEEGAKAYLTRQFRTLALFVLLVFALLFLLPGDTGVRLGRSIAFLIGAGFSAVIGSVGMRLAVKANVRVAAAAGGKDGYAAGAKVAFRTGGTVGLFTVGLGLLGATGAVLIFREEAPGVLEGFGFGAALLAMFMRVGGGIFTKAADVGADLVGKVEQGIPEDDPRNPATIADNVGDNVGDCAGMAADLFESYAVTLVASLILGKAAFGEQGLVFPLLIASIGMITAAVGVYLTRMRRGENGLVAINRGFYISAVIGAVLSVVAAYVYLPSNFESVSFASVGLASPYTYTNANGAQVALITGDPRMLASIAVIVGIVLAGVILWLTGFFTGTDKPPTMKVARTSRTGAATVVLSGIGVGFESAVYTAVAIGAAVAFLFTLSGGLLPLGLFFLAIAGCGLLTTVGVIVAMDTFGPVSDNAQGIAEMSGEASEEAAEILTGLDAVGNTTKAITKGIAIATAVLAAAALFGSYRDAVSTALNEVSQDVLASAPVLMQTALSNFQIFTPTNIFGLILGGAVVFLFAGLATDAVTRAAGSIVYEVRRQFRDNPGIMTFDTKPNYAACVDICTKDSLRELVTPGLLAAMAPIAVGFGLGPGPLAAFLAGSIITGVLMAVFLSNAGGAWDNAKKIVEDGSYGGKGSDAHAATVIGDTVGDPFKDTAGPAINPLIKVMNLVALLIVPTVVTLSVGENENTGGRIIIALLALVVIIGAVLASKLRRSSMDEDFEDDVDFVDESDEDIEGGGDPSVALISVEDDPATQVAGSDPRDLFSGSTSPRARVDEGTPEFETSEAPVSSFVGSQSRAGASVPGGNTSARVVPVPVNRAESPVSADHDGSAEAGSAEVAAEVAAEAGSAEVAAEAGSAEVAAEAGSAEVGSAGSAEAEAAADDDVLDATDDEPAARITDEAVVASAGNARDDLVDETSYKAADEVSGVTDTEAEYRSTEVSGDAETAYEASDANVANDAIDATVAGEASDDESADVSADQPVEVASFAAPAGGESASDPYAADVQGATAPNTAEAVTADDSGDWADSAPEVEADEAVNSSTRAQSTVDESSSVDTADARESGTTGSVTEASPVMADSTITEGAEAAPADEAAPRANADVTSDPATVAVADTAPAASDTSDQVAAPAAVGIATTADTTAATTAGTTRADSGKRSAQVSGDAPHGPDSALPLANGKGPEGFTIKGNSNSMKYHTTESPYYKRTKAEVWFRTEAAAIAAGYQNAGGNRGFSFEPGPYPNSAKPAADGSGPEGYPIKGNEDSMKFHGPDSPWYVRTKAEYWFKTEEDARAAGFKKPGE